jgi:bifunctional polynucleotide phosphatase/kinase
MSTNKSTKKITQTVVQKDKIAVFDVDWTIIKPLSDGTFPKSVDDWQWFRNSVPETIRMYHDQGYKIILWTNQSKVWKVDMIDAVIHKLDIEIDVVICTNKDDYKPNVDYFWCNVNTKTGSINLDFEESFMCGDALGRDGDHSSCDLDGANLLNIDCYSPEDIFPENPSDELILEPTEHKEIIIMSGYPGAGKTTLASGMKGYRTLSLDNIKTIPKLLKAALLQIEYSSIIFDATNMTVAKRKVYVDFANRCHLPVRCVWINMSAQKSIDRNIIRASNAGRRVPNVAIYKLRKTAEDPTENEGFKLIRFDVR